MNAPAVDRVPLNTESSVEEFADAFATSSAIVDNPASTAAELVEALRVFEHVQIRERHRFRQSTTPGYEWIADWRDAWEEHPQAEAVQQLLSDASAQQQAAALMFQGGRDQTLVDSALRAAKEELAGARTDEARRAIQEQVFDVMLQTGVTLEADRFQQVFTQATPAAQTSHAVTAGTDDAFRIVEHMFRSTTEPASDPAYAEMYRAIVDNDDEYGRRRPVREFAESISVLRNPTSSPEDLVSALRALVEIEYCSVWEREPNRRAPEAWITAWSAAWNAHPQAAEARAQLADTDPALQAFVLMTLDDAELLAGAVSDAAAKDHTRAPSREYQALVYERLLNGPTPLTPNQQRALLPFLNVPTQIAYADARGSELGEEMLLAYPDRMPDWAPEVISSLLSSGRIVRDPASTPEQLAAALDVFNKVPVPYDEDWDRQESKYIWRSRAEADAWRRDWITNWRRHPQHEAALAALGQMPANIQSAALMFVKNRPDLMDNAIQTALQEQAQWLGDDDEVASLLRNGYTDSHRDRENWRYDTFDRLLNARTAPTPEQFAQIAEHAGHKAIERLAEKEGLAPELYDAITEFAAARRSAYNHELCDILEANPDLPASARELLAASEPKVETAQVHEQSI